MPRLNGKAPTILVVEDDAILRMAAVDFSEDAGFDVLEAANADEAIAILEKRDDIRLVFTDIDMPGSMDGLKLAQFVRGRWPPIRLIVTSGHVKITAGDIPEGALFFAKPYDAGEIAGALHRLTC